MYSPIYYAVFSGSLETVKFFMNESKDLKNKAFINPFHLAAIINNVEVGKLLLEKYKVNSTDKQNHTPLMYAIKNHSNEFIQFLLQQPDIDINSQDNVLLFY